VANCNICNKEILEGNTCLDCIKARRQQAAGTAPTSGSGFSLNTLLKTTPPSPSPNTTFPAAQAPRPQPAPATPTTTDQFNKNSSILNYPAAHPSSNLSEHSETTRSINTPTDVPARILSPQVPESLAQSAEPVATTSISNTSAANSSTRSPAQENPIPGKKAEIEEKKELERKVFSSHITGYGDEDLETAILSGIMKDCYILDSLKGKGLISGLFSTRFSRAIYQCILSLREETPELSGLDKIVLKNKLRQMNLWDNSVQAQLEKIVSEAPPSMDQALHYLDMMKEQALKRKLKEVAHEISDYIENPEKEEKFNLETFTNKVIQDVRNIQKARTTKRINLVKEEMRDIITDIETREKVGEIDIIGYSFEPMHYLNTAISGFRKGFMYAIAGAPRRGKTTFTLELATRVATLNKIPVLFFTYEQTKKNLTYRLLAKESRLNPDTLQRKKIRSDLIVDAKFMGGWKKMQEYMDYFYIIEATKEDTVDRIRSYAYNAMQDFNTEDIMIFVDYIQKMPLSRNYMDEKFKVEEISTELKGLSIELNNPIMTISSLSKEGCMVDATPDGERPTMYHCKGSGDLEYDLDCAMIQAKDWGDTRELYQQLQHKAEELNKDTTRIPKVDVVNLYLDKNRDAPEGIFSTIQYLFFIEDNKFIELGPKFDDDRFRFSKIEELVDKLIEQNFIIFYDRPKDNSYNKGRVSIKLKNF